MQETPEFNSIDEYIEMFPKEVQARLTQIRKIIKEIVPEAEEVISYQMPTFDLNGRHLVHFAAFKNHIGFYPLPSGVVEFQKLAEGFPSAKGSVQFPHDKPIPFDIVKKVVEFRVAENLAKPKKK